MRDFRNRRVVSEPGLLLSLLAYGLAAACYIALVGLVVKVWRWARIPQPVPIPLTPAPRSRAGVVLRLALEMLVFRTLWRANRVTWLGCVLLHYGLLLTVLLHLRFLLPGAPLWLVPLIPYGSMASLALVAGLGLLLARRVLLARVRYVSVPSDFAWLLLLLTIAISGLVLKRWAFVDAYAVGRFLRAALQFDVLPLAGNTVLWMHVLAVMVLLTLFPFGKLLHAPGLAFAPTLNTRAR